MIAMDVWCPWELATLNKQRHESQATLLARLKQVEIVNPPT